MLEYWKNKLLMGTMVLFFTTIISSSCKSDFSKYHADWIVSKAEYAGENVYPNITLFNFNINVDRRTARPPKINLSDEFYLSKEIPIKLSQKEGKDYLEILDHPTLKGKFEIRCLDVVCCTISLKNDKTFLELFYNSEIPFGVKRDCR